MRRTFLALAAGIILGVVATLGYAEVSGGWWEYTILPESRCRPTGGPAIGVAEPVPYASHPCVFRRPRWSIFS